MHTPWDKAADRWFCFLLLQFMFLFYWICDVETRKKESISKSDLGHKNAAFKISGPLAGLDF